MNQNLIPTESAVFQMLNPEPSQTVAIDGDRRIPYVTYHLPDFISRAIGKGCVCRTLGVQEGSSVPVVVCIRYSPDGEWIGVWTGCAEPAEAERIAASYRARF